MRKSFHFSMLIILVKMNLLNFLYSFFNNPFLRIFLPVLWALLLWTTWQPLLLYTDCFVTPVCLLWLTPARLSLTDLIVHKCIWFIQKTFSLSCQINLCFHQSKVSTSIFLKGFSFDQSEVYLTLTSNLLLWPKLACFFDCRIFN